MLRGRKPAPIDTSNQRLTVDVENVITRLDSVVDRLDIVSERLLPLIEKLTIAPKGDRDRGGGNPDRPGLAH